MDTKLESHDNNGALQEKFIKDHNNQAAQDLLLNHTNEIKIGGRVLLNYSKKIGEKIDSIDNTLIRNKILRKQHLNSLSVKQREIKQSIEKLYGFAGELESVLMENKKIWNENEKLRDEIEELKRVIKLQKVRIMELENNYEL